MPGFTIHIAIAKQYIAKHELEIKDEKEFIKGSIAPDLNEEMNGLAEDKSKSHYGQWGIYEALTDIEKFLKDPKVDMKQDFWKGYFLHLLADKYFYNKDKYFKNEYEEMKNNKDKFYNDYDCLNKNLIEKYEIELLENIKKYMNTYEGKTKYLKEDKIINFIEEVSDMNIQDEIKKLEGQS